MKAKLRLEVYHTDKLRPAEQLSDIFTHAKPELGVTDLQALHAHAYLLELEVDSGQTGPKLQQKIERVFCGPVLQKACWSHQELKSQSFQLLEDVDYVVEVFHKPGVTDNAGASAQEGLELVGLKGRVGARDLYFFKTKVQREVVQRLSLEYLANGLIQNVQVWRAADFFDEKRFEEVIFDDVELESFEKPFEVVDFSQDLNSLQKLNQQQCWAFSEIELNFLKDYFLSSDWKKQREEKSLPFEPTDVEVEVIAQSWSEHCKHKIFGATIEYSESSLDDSSKNFGPQKIEGLYKQFIKKATREIQEQGRPELISVFTDNAGIVRFHGDIDLCLKVETHNSPSALDPYGGALTGILGVNRDILGCGLGAKPMANLDVFCFGPPDWPPRGYEEYMPSGLKHPRRILEGVHKGVEDGGNKSGIPTVNGAMHFDPDYSGKPLVFVGTLGVMPQKTKSGRKTSEKCTSVGDKIVVIGGDVGADGIHGATFSSLELNESSPLSAVQIGDPLTQKRVLDFIQYARDEELFSGVTDNGAGGLSSSLGEMATLTGGARFDLALNPTKYPNLKPFEIMISESQERMSFSVPEDTMEDFLAACQRFGVKATVLGEFSDSGFLEVFYNEDLVAHLDLEFLHEGLPSMQLKATWNGPRTRKSWMPKAESPGFDGRYDNALLKLLSTPNVASKERWVRQYDHEVQGATHLKPFCGQEFQAPGDGAGIWLYPHGGEQDELAFLGVGLSPRLSLHDPYEMAKASVDEAVRNIVVSGANPDQLFLLDNFCWPDPVASPKNPDGEQKLAELVRSCMGLYETCRSYHAPLISGKDSMKNDFRGVNRKGEALQISILPTLLVSALGRGKIGQTVDACFKQAGDVIYLLGHQQKALAGSLFLEHFSLQDSVAIQDIPRCFDQKNIELYRSFHKALTKGLIQSAHDLSEGGLLVALAECTLDSGLGAKLELEADPALAFHESPGCLLVSVRSKDAANFEKTMAEHEFERLGIVDQKTHLQVDSLALDIPNTVLKEAFTREF